MGDDDEHFSNSSLYAVVIHPCVKWDDGRTPMGPTIERNITEYHGISKKPCGFHMQRLRCQAKHCSIQSKQSEYGFVPGGLYADQYSPIGSMGKIGTVKHSFTKFTPIFRQSQNILFYFHIFPYESWWIFIYGWWMLMIFLPTCAHPVHPLVIAATLWWSNVERGKSSLRRRHVPLLCLIRGGTEDTPT